MTSTAQDYDIAEVRKLLVEAFTPESFRRFCLDRPILRPAMQGFGSGHGMDDMVDEVINYCRVMLLWDELLSAVREENPRQYDRFEFKTISGLRPHHATIKQMQTGFRHPSEETPSLEHALVSPEVHLSSVPIGIVYTLTGSRSGLAVILTAQTRSILFGRTERPEDQEIADEKVVIPDPVMSRNHFLIGVSPEGSESGQGRSYAVSVKDAGSKNGSWLNGQRFYGEEPLKDGDVIQAGGTDFLVRLF